MSTNSFQLEKVFLFDFDYFKKESLYGFSTPERPTIKSMPPAPKKNASVAKKRCREEEEEEILEKKNVIIDSDLCTKFRVEVNESLKNIAKRLGFTYIHLGNLTYSENSINGQVMLLY